MEIILGSYRVGEEFWYDSTYIIELVAGQPRVTLLHGASGLQNAIRNTSHEILGGGSIYYDSNPEIECSVSGLYLSCCPYPYEGKEMRVQLAQALQAMLGGEWEVYVSDEEQTEHRASPALTVTLAGEVVDTYEHHLAMGYYDPDSEPAP